MNQKPLRALTVYQPWASLIIVGAKPYEFRSRPTPRTIIGERIVIHAAARRIEQSEVTRLIRALKGLDGDAARHETCLHADKAWEVLTLAQRGQLPISAGIGTAIAGEGRLGTEIAEEFGVPRANDSDRDEHSNWGWPMSEPHAWERPIPQAGSQGIWFWPAPEDFGL